MSISVNEAFELILRNTISIEKTQLIKIEDSSYRISSKTIKATYPLPRFDNSAMDGYAVYLENKNSKIEVIDKIFAGDNKNIKLKPNTAIKIMTGAKIPQGTQAIVPQENVEIFNDGYIKLPENLQQNQHIRFSGEDVQVGNIIVKQNEEINYAIISLLASQGIIECECFQKPRIAVFSSGEELRPHYEKIESYQIYNSNSPTLVSRSKELSCDATFIGSAKDNVEDIKKHIEKSLDYDLIITSGGVSVGEADFTKESFESFDMDYIFNGITIKPGKPTVFGKINNSYILNLPGNPLASQLIFEFFGKIIIAKLSGSKNIFHNVIKAKLKVDLPNKKGRQTIIPGFFDGEYFTPSKKRSPGMVSVLSSCNSMIVLDEKVEYLKTGNQVNILPLNCKFYASEKKDYLTYE